MEWEQESFGRHSCETEINQGGRKVSKREKENWRVCYCKSTWLGNPAIKLQLQCQKIWITFHFKKKSVLIKQCAIHLSCTAEINPLLSSDYKCIHCKSSTLIDLKSHALICCHIYLRCSDTEPGNVVQKIISMWKNKSLALGHNVSLPRAKLASTVMFISIFLMLSNKILKMPFEETNSYSEEESQNTFSSLGHLLAHSLSGSFFFAWATLSFLFVFIYFNNSKNSQMKYICLGFSRIQLAVRFKSTWSPLSEEYVTNGKAQKGLKNHIANQWLSRRRTKGTLMLFLKC